MEESMTAWRIEIGLSLLTLAFSLVAIQRWGSMSPQPTLAGTVSSAPETGTAVSAALLDEAALVATEQNPFRLSRTPSDVAFVPRRVAMATPSGPPAFRGVLVLKGIVGGPPWHAVIDGLPGQPPGTMVSAGSTFDKLVIRAISRDTVVVQAPDTVWRLTLTKGT
jgi:hypothetical protein